MKILGRMKAKAGAFADWFLEADPRLAGLIGGLVVMVVAFGLFLVVTAFFTPEHRMVRCVGFAVGIGLGMSLMIWHDQKKDHASRSQVE